MDCVKAYETNRSTISRVALGAIVGAGMLAMTVPAEAGPLPESFADLAANVTPAVVNISSRHSVEVAQGQEGPELPFSFPPGSPFEEFFRQFQHRFGQGQGQGEQRPLPDRIALGSGFIIDPAGYVVTNNHVIKDATEITVTLTTGKEYQAELVGTDPKTDLALLKVKADEPLPSVDWGDSDAVRVGDWVVAVGNPFGLGGSVTAGIVSAHNRYINAGPYDNFLQIDAAINQGNSGGPTFNEEGQVIGINTAIFSPNGGSVGIGFAIPSNIAKPIIAELRDHGSVERGWLGVMIQPVTPEIASALGLDRPAGALVASVQPDSPAEAAGLEQGDVILDYDGTKLDKMRKLPWLVASTPIGDKAELGVWRDGGEQTVEVKIGRMKAEEHAAAAEPTRSGAPSDTSETLGATLATITPELKQEFSIGDNVAGVVVVDVKAHGPAAEQGLRPGDVIEKVAQAKVSSPAQVEAAVKAAKQGSVLLLINRQGVSQFVAVDVGTA